MLIIHRYTRPFLKTIVKGLEVKQLDVEDLPEL